MTQSIDQATTTATTTKEPLPPDILGVCPSCGAEVIGTPQGWGCSAYYDTGCRFTIWDEIGGVEITQEMVRALLAGEVLGPFDMVSRKRAAHAYRAYLQVKDGALVRDFVNEDAAVIGDCPECRSAVIERPKSWRCSSSDCDLVIWKEVGGRKITEQLAAELLEKGRTPLLEGFKGYTSGKSFAAVLVLEGGAVHYEFPPRSRKKAA